MVSKRSDWIIIGISGVTCGGKTSLAVRLRGALRPARVFHQDQYFLRDDSPRHVRCAGTQLPHNNYDVLSALDMDAMLRDVTRALQDDCAPADGDPAPSPPSPRDPLSPRDSVFSIPGKRFLIVEGFTVLNYKPIMKMCDLRYYFVLEYGECVARRSLRLYSPPDVPGYFEHCVWPEHLKYKAEIEKDSRVKFIDGTQGNAYEIVMADLRAKYT